MNPAKLRARAAGILARLQQQEGSLATLLTRRDEGDEEGFALLQEIVFGTCRWFHQLDAILKLLLDKPLKTKDADLHGLLLIGLYQLQHLRVPEYAVVNETVAATKVLGKGWARGLVNAVLRNFLREQTDLIAKAAESLEGQYAHPRWLIKTLQQDWPEQWPRILEQNNQRPPMTLRVNTRRMARDAYLQALKNAGLDATAGTLTDSAVYLDKPCSVDRLPEFDAGLVSVQDEASQVIPSLLDLADGQRILDACAAPGGKTCHLLESGYAFSGLVALDNDERRLERLRQNLDRLHLEAEVVCADATATQSWWDGTPFDRILLDAPCSATGIIRRHPDIKLLRRSTDIPKLQALQLLLLQRLWACLKPGGLLLYSTCSVLRAENSQTVATFLKTQGDAKHERIDGQWGVECAFGRQLLPDSAGNDGFYFARIRKPA